jgi:hypothetical protein
MVSDAFVLRVCACSRRDRAVPSFDKWSALRLTAMSLPSSLPRRGRVARGEWGNLTVLYALYALGQVPHYMGERSLG